MISRTSNTVSFTTPEVAQDTTLHFSLTVTNAKNITSTVTAQVLVKGIRDFDRFLQYLRVDNTFPVVITTQTPIAANSAALATDTLPLTITMTKLVSFTDRLGNVHSRVPVGTPITTTASWSQRIGTGSNCSDNINPKLRLTIPRVNTDDLLNAPITRIS